MKAYIIDYGMEMPPFMRYGICADPNGDVVGECDDHMEALIKAMEMNHSNAPLKIGNDGDVYYEVKPNNGND